MTRSNPIIADYEDHFRSHHALRVSQYFESLVQQTGIDEQANQLIVRDIQELAGALAKQTSTRNWWNAGRFLGLAASLALVILALDLKGWNYGWILPAVIAVLVVFTKINPRIRQSNNQIETTQAAINDKKAIAWSQMDGLNKAYSWDNARLLFQQTCPGVELDSMFSAERLNDLCTNFDMDPASSKGRAAVLVQSGSMRGNPFVITRFLRQWIGKKEYSGSLTIHWRERQGNTYVDRSQVLTAYVDKPCPMYARKTFLIFGHEAGAHLSFSRSPTKLSSLKESPLNDWRKDRAVKKAEARARRGIRTGESGYTVMANRDFEALFGASDRNQEVEFRLLFTPVAQEHMVDLLSNLETGYGDNFEFIKSKRTNFIAPNHLQKFRFDCDPRLFMTFDLNAARTYFNQFHNEYFRAIYFALAPLMTIPIYQEPRNAGNIQHPCQDSRGSAWEHESMAYFLGEEKFRHPNSATRTILKTSAQAVGAGNTVKLLTVTAHGFEAIERLDIVQVYGGDGRFHDVPVPWIKYIAVQRDSLMLVGVVKDPSKVPDPATQLRFESEWGDALRAIGLSKEDSFTRGPLAAAYVGDYYRPQNPMVPEVLGGWYPDPSDQTQWRYWDGTEWTSHVSPRQSN